MEFTDFFETPIPPLIHGEFDTASGREIQQIDRESNISIQKISAAELNFRTDIFTRNKSSDCQIDNKILNKAADEFLHGFVLGQSFEEYCGFVSTTARIPISTAKNSAIHLAAALRNTVEKTQNSHRKNSFLVSDLGRKHPPKCGLIRIRKGDNLSVSLPGNGPGPNSVWIEALLYGYEVILRPSLRDIFTPLRLVKCLLNAGVPRSMLSIIFCDYLAHNTLVERSDLSLVFGGRELERKYQKDSDVKVYGPGRSVTVLDPELYSPKVADEIIESIIGAGGVACFNTSLLLLTQPVENFEQMFVGTMTTIMEERLNFGQDDRPIVLRDTYQNLLTLNLLGDETTIVYDGTTSVNDTEVRAGPLIYKRRGFITSQDILEFPFPAVEVTFLQDTNIEEIVHKSLATAVYSLNQSLIYKIFHSRSGGRVLINTNSISDFKGLPHDGHLSDFLMVERPFVNSSD